MMSRIGSLLFLLVATIGCGQPLVRDSPPPTGNEGYFVFGAGPAQYQFQVFSGSVNSAEIFRVGGLEGAAFNGVPNGGYAVGKARGGSTVAVTRVFDPASGILSSDSYLLCAPAKTLVFTVEPGKVIYLTDVTFKKEGSNFGLENKPSIERARLHVAGHYPALAPLLTQGEFKMLTTNVPCKDTIYIPIPIYK